MGERSDLLFLLLKSVLVLVGVLLIAAAAVDLVVVGATPTNVVTLVVGLLLAGLPLAVAFRAALRAKPPG